MNLQLNFRKLWILSAIIMLFMAGISSCKKTSELTARTSDEPGDLASARVTGKPNIILILGDDIGFEIPTVDGGRSYETPNIDAMAGQGMRFTQAYASPLCSPSRFMLMTGKYNFRNYTAWGVMKPNEKTLATLLKSAGYTTYVSGKWQFDGGDAGIHSLGFDDYSVWDAYENDNFLGSHYKNPAIYENGGLLPTSVTINKYGDDIFTDRVLNFVSTNRNKKFFVYFPITLAHKPFCPTPDDPEFDNWDPSDSNSDATFFPSMIKYMDKKIGQLNDSLKAWNLYNNTIIIFAGDNGTPSEIISKFNNKNLIGGKSQSNITGTRIPMMITWPAKIVPGTVNGNLVDFTDFLPTFAEAAGISVPTDYGMIDGVSFYKQFSNVNSPSRSWVFNHYQPLSKDGENQNLKRWAQNKLYKLYDSSDNFYNIKDDPYERKPIRNLSVGEQQSKATLRAVIDAEHN